MYMKWCGFFQFPYMGVIAHLAFDKINPWGRLTSGGLHIYTCDAVHCTSARLCVCTTHC